MLPFGVVGNWITSTLKGGSLFVSKFHALYPSVRTPSLRDPCLRSVCWSALVPVLVHMLTPRLSFLFARSQVKA
jgi:hypothetical protein